MDVSEVRVTMSLCSLSIIVTRPPENDDGPGTFRMIFFQIFGFFEILENLCNGIGLVGVGGGWVVLFVGY